MAAIANQKKIEQDFFLLFWAAAPKGSMTYAFTHMGIFSFSSSSFYVPPSQIPISRPKFQS